MDIIVIVFVIIVIIVAALIVIRYLLNQKKRTAQSIRDYEYYRKRQQSADFGKGFVIHSDGGAMPTGPSSKVPVALTLEITPGTGEPYRARTQWLVDVTAQSYVAQGQEVAVKIDMDDKSIIYPNASWARYVP